MGVVLTYGTFDLFHVGHAKLLRRLKGLGENLIVGCSTDEFNKEKGKNCVIPYSDRVEILLSCRYVDEVFPETSWDQKVHDIKRFGANIFAMGDDWLGKFDYLQEETGCAVTYVARTPGVSTTDLKGMLRSIEEEKISEIKRAASKLNELVQKY